jgi:hypothetical protein
MKEMSNRNGTGMFRFGTDTAHLGVFQLPARWKLTPGD